VKTIDEKSPQPFRNVSTIFLMHILPGLPIMLVYITLAPLGIKWGIPTIFTLTSAIIFALIPVQMGILLWQGYRIHGHLTLKDVIYFRQAISKKRATLDIIMILIWSIIVFAILSTPLRTYIIPRLFQWAPNWYTTIDSFAGSPRILWATWFLLIVFGSILGPAVEELYFRGFLLPRMTQLGKWAPLVNAFLFSLYHLWSPWDLITRTIAVTPLSYLVAKRRNLYIGMIVHILLNLLSTLLLLPLIIS
jgi:hypothetical protein